nr:isoprenylcysteine carboxylmethyltransferase family protein [Candidatus Baldrarchaeota archaeon]
MYIWFFTCIMGMIAVIPVHFISVEHLKLEEKYGKERGKRIGEICGIISGWLFFLFWIGVWISPQPRFTVPILQSIVIGLPAVGLKVPLLHLVIFAPFFVLGAWFGISGVKEVTLRVAETHRTDKIITKGVYSVVRHPQYLGGLLAHVGISFLLSSLYSLLSTPLIAVIVYLISWKEEKELTREFGEEYEKYRKNVPMFIPRLRKKTKRS